MKRYTHRIRRCEGNKAAWCLVALRDDGSEITSYGGFTTALSIDALLLGKPDVPVGGRLLLIDDGTRYAIEEA